jgi:PPP family 3-phenylpropionic acid transporter
MILLFDSEEHGLMKRQLTEKYPVYLFLHYYLLYASIGAAYLFFPLYLDNLNFSKTNIGLILAIPPIITLFAQPFWGYIGDRAKYKNNILLIIAIGGGICYFLLGLNVSIIYIFIMFALFAFFQSPYISISDTITLEILKKSKFTYGPVRIGGTIGFAITVLTLGLILKENIKGIFLITLIIFFLAILTIRKMPKIEGHQNKENPVSVRLLLKNKNLMQILILNMVIFITIMFFEAFFALDFKEMGASTSLYGRAMFTVAMFEIPFLIFAKKIIIKFSIKKILLIATLLTAIRWLLHFLITDINIVIWFGVLSGLALPAFFFTTVIYISEVVPKELRSSGQTLYGLLAWGAGKAIACIFGGFILDAFSFKTVYFSFFIICSIAFLVFLFLFKEPES